MGKTHNLCEEKPITITENTTENTTEKKIYEFQKNIPTAQAKKKSVVVKYNYTPEFEEIRSAFPEARSGNKKEAYDEYVNNWTEEELKEQIKILKRQIRV